jgi:hypothetical protein
VDISQNNHQKGQQHWDNAQKQKKRIASHVRPLNNVKIYGADSRGFGSGRDAQERFWRNIFGGLASARFHRPDAGLGLGKKAQANIKSMRMLTNEMDIFNCQPHNDRLSERQMNEAYCIANPPKEYAVFFPRGGSVKLNISTPGKRRVQWLNILQSAWNEPLVSEEEDVIKLDCPDEGFWVVLIK